MLQPGVDNTLHRLSGYYEMKQAC